jgi:hypothetical protein
MPAAAAVMAAAASVAAAVASAAMAATARTMSAAVTGPVAAATWAMSAVTWPVTVTWPIAVARSVDMDVPIDVHVAINVDVAIDVDVAVVPATPAGGAAPAYSTRPRVAAPVPARASPGGAVPAVIPAAPDELRLLHRRAFGERSRRLECADADRRFRGKDELGDHPGSRSERQNEFAKHEHLLRVGRLWRSCLNAR